MSIITRVIPDLVADHSLSINSEGEVECTKRYLVYFEATAGENISTINGIPLAAAVLKAVDSYDQSKRVPSYGDPLFAGSISGLGNGNATVTNIEASPTEDDPWRFNVEVSYGKDANEDNNGDDDDSQDPPRHDEQKERYPWEQRVSVSFNFGGGNEVVPEMAATEVSNGNYPASYTLAQVESQKANPGGAVFTGGKMLPLMNSAGDLLMDPPTRPVKTGTITMSFDIVDTTGWNISAFISTYLNKVNLQGVSWGHVGLIYGEWAAPAGVLKVTGFTCEDKQYTEVKKWYPRERHPFGWTNSNGSILINGTKYEKSVERTIQYHSMSITLEYNEQGYLIYPQDMGYRQLLPDIGLRPIMLDEEFVTSPTKLNGQGIAMDQSDKSYLTNTYFLRYRYYDYVQFDFLSLIPWMGQVIDVNAL